MITIQPAAVIMAILVSASAISGDALRSNKGAQLKAIERSEQLFWFAYLCSSSLDDPNLLNLAAARSVEILAESGLSPEEAQQRTIALGEVMFDIEPFEQDQCEAEMPPELSADE